MNRSEKNQQTRRRIMDSALAEFAHQGYGASSVNTICAAGGISKGIIYHYFKTKDDLYLACVDECFQLLTEHLESRVAHENASLEQQLGNYFAVRAGFFRDHPVYQRIFSETVVSPPAHLKTELQNRKRGFDNLNIAILNRLLVPAALRPDVSRAEVIETFRQYQDFINAKYQMTDMNPQEFEMRDESCRKALSILLYGIIEREEDKNA
jgi:AcrR family transcriptional regulator